MLWIVILAVCGVIPLIVLFAIRGRDSQGPRERTKQTMLYSPGSEDVAGAAYHPGRKDGAMPFPLSKRKERKRTETFRRHSKD